MTKKIVHSEWLVLRSCFIIWLIVGPLGHAQVATEWVARYNGPADSVDVARFIALDPSSGNIYVAGHTWEWNGEYNIILMKYTPAGDTVWTRRYNGPGNYWDVFRSAAVDGNGNVYIAAVTFGVGTFWDIVTLKYDAQGVLRWTAFYNNPLANWWDDPHDIAVDRQGNVYVVGKSSATTGLMDFDYVTIKYSPEGAPLWVRRFNGVGNFSDVARAVAVDDSGNVFVTGSSAENSTPPYITHIITIKYNSSGAQVWLADYYYEPGAGGAGQHIALDANGNVYVSGLSFSTESQDIATIKYNPSGETLWVQRYNGPENGHDEVWDMVVDASANVFITGYTGLGARGVTIKYSTTGVQEWVAQTSVTGVGTFALTLDRLGNIYITGKCWTPQTYDDMVTIKYNPFGVEQWVMQYNGPGNHLDYSNAIVVDGYGNVYVAGESIGSRTNYDVVVIKYAGTTGVVDVTAEPEQFRLLQNYPNPFNSSTRIRFSIASKNGRGGESENVSLKVYDVLGREVATLANEVIAPGTYDLTWDALGMPSGVYFYQLKAGNLVSTRKMLLLR
jgi:uncharacterized delta-60 repeat protein